MTFNVGDKVRVTNLYGKTEDEYGNTYGIVGTDSVILALVPGTSERFGPKYKIGGEGWSGHYYESELELISSAPNTELDEWIEDFKARLDSGLPVNSNRALLQLAEIVRDSR